jgi:dienelactone hydrolase
MRPTLPAGRRTFPTAASEYEPNGGLATGRPWPGVLVVTDIFGRRDPFLPVGDRLASLGYVALIPDVYYREGDYAPFDLKGRRLARARRRA